MATKHRKSKNINKGLILTIAVAAVIIIFVVAYGGTSTAKFYAAGKTPYAQKQQATKQISGSPPVRTQCVPSQEVCDGKDNDCNSKIDDGLAQYNYYNDRDKDTYGDAVAPAFVVTCYDKPQAGQSLTTDDCDDTNANVHPAAAEICGNNFDDDCNGLFDETCEICDGTDNDSNGVVDDGAVCNTQSNCGTYGNTCAAGQQCAYNETLIKFNCV